jgi:hypothetical protein
VNLIQEVLDGNASPGPIESTPHVKECAACRERLRAAKLLLSTFAAPTPITVPSGLTDSILGTMQARDRARFRQRVFAGLSVALAASIALVLWFRTPTTTPDSKNDVVEIPLVIMQQPPEVTPPMRLETELAKAGESFRDSTRTITQPAATVPNAFASLTSALLKPTVQPAVANLEPARKSLSDIPEAAKVGFEPVTGSAQKAYNRFLRDVSAVTVKPNS